MIARLSCISFGRRRLNVSPSLQVVSGVICVDTCLYLRSRLSITFDKHTGVQAPLELAANSYRALADYLVQPATTDIGRARSFFVWIASQRLQNIVDFVDNTIPSEDSPLYTVLLMLLKQWGNGYSELFSNLCRYVCFCSHFLDSVLSHQFNIIPPRVNRCNCMTISEHF